MYQIDTMDQYDISVEELIKKNNHFFKEINDTEFDFISNIINKIIQDKGSIDDKISKNLIGWKIGRLTPIDRNLIRMGIAESAETGKKIIIIDDIVRIAKKYGGAESYKIINAVLDKVIE